jgi:hypothetical protein
VWRVAPPQGDRWARAWRAPTLTKAAPMTPKDVPGQIVTIESLFPWLAAIVPAQEPVRPIRRDSEPTPEPERLPDAA